MPECCFNWYCAKKTCWIHCLIQPHLTLPYTGEWGRLNLTGLRWFFFFLLQRWQRYTSVSRSTDTFKTNLVKVQTGLELAELPLKAKESHAASNWKWKRKWPEGAGVECRPRRGYNSGGGGVREVLRTQLRTRMLMEASRKPLFLFSRPRRSPLWTRRLRLHVRT